MAYKYTFNRVMLDYESSTPYISGSSIFQYNSARYWFFVIENKLTVGSSTGTYTKMAFYLPPSGDTTTTTKLRMVTDYNPSEDSYGWYASGSASLQYGASAEDVPTPIYETNSNWYTQNYTFNVQDYSNHTVTSNTYTTNIPVFLNYDDAYDYIIGEKEITDAINYGGEAAPQTTTFVMYNTGIEGTWTVDGVTNTGSPIYRWFKLKVSTSDLVDGRFAFYRQGLINGVIKLIPVIGSEIYSCRYSTNGGADWVTSDSFPFEYLFGERIDEIGTFQYATRLGTTPDGVPIFETEEEANNWVNHTGDTTIADALNYEVLADRYGITNPTGTDITATEFGTASNFRSHFTQQYILDRSEVTIIADALYDTGSGGFWENIKAGVEMFGDSPISSVCGLTYYPIDLSTVFTRLTPQTYIYFGGYMFPPEGSSTSLSVYKLNGYDGYIDIGTFTIEPAFSQDDYRNWEPYCSLTLYLPFIGMQKVSYNKYLNKTIKIRYYIDITNGSCLCILMANNKMMDYFNGSIGIQVPITLTDFSSYSQAQIRNLSNMAGVGGNITGAGISAASGNIGGTVTGSIGAVGGFEKSMFEVSTTNINQFNTTKGSSGPMGNQYLPQKVYAIFEYIKTETTENLNQLEGIPSNASGNLGNFSGYLEADSIMLRTSAGMSEAEKAEFINLVQSGIYI